MKKTFIAYLFLVTITNLYSQTSTPQISNDLPQISPPSPTVAALMKFEEIPVSNYTGVPDISIPLFNTSTRSEGVNINIALKYHPSEIQVENIAGWAGVGWSLDAGGTISRTIKGCPDEAALNKKGVYDTSNNYESIFFTSTGSFIYDNRTYDRFQYTWQAYEKDSYDTEYDLYQFNFMGNAGSFYMKKDGAIIKLFNNLAIQIEYSTANKAFTLYDDKGYKFVFNVLESSNESKFVALNSRDGSVVYPPISQWSPYISAYHLSTITDRNSQLLATFTYSDVLEVVEHRIETTNEDYFENNVRLAADLCPDFGGDLLNMGRLLPYSSLTISTNSITTKKLQNISIEGKAKINFTTESGRQDLNTEAVRLKGVQISDWNNNLVKEYALVHSYLGAGKRLVLQKVQQKKTGSSETQDYTLQYNNIQNLPVRTSKDKDWWGYFNNSSNLVSGQNSECNPTFCKTGVLQRMILPTGGSTVFDFESNQYSYEGSTSLTQFDNPQNRISQTIAQSYSGSVSVNNTNSIYFNLNVNQTVNLTISTTGFSPVASKNYWYFQIIPVQALPPGTGPAGPVELTLVPSYTVDNSRPQINIYTKDLDATLASNYYVFNKYLNSGAYVIRFLTNPNGPPVPSTGGTYALTVKYNKLASTYKYVNGGGLRVNYIGYFKDAVEPDYYSLIVNNPTIPMPLPDKEKKYNYNNFDDPMRSSGSLSYAKPVYKYMLTKNTMLVCLNTDGGPGPSMTHDFRYWVTNNFNSLNPLKTQGSDIGYKYVTVTDNRRSFTAQQGDIDISYIPSDNADLGRTEYTYTSPIDYPADVYAVVYPFTSLNNDYDYKRGLLKVQKQYDKSNKLLTESNFDYTIDEGSIITGARLYSISGCGYSAFWNTFEGYYDAATDPDCGYGPSATCTYTCGYPFDYLLYMPINQLFGWPKMTAKNTKEYFYNSDNTAQGTKETQQSFNYNSTNKQMDSDTTTNSLGETLLNNYYYVNYPTNRIADIDYIETRKNGTLMGTSKIIYSNAFTGNTSYLPSYVQAATGTQPLENRLQFVKYDVNSNVVEAKKSNGTSAVYIYGYNKTVPIAKIENSTATAVATALGGGDLVNYNESNMTAIDNLRTNASMATALITTYTYIPLVGVSTITDPKGYKITYTYDGYGRLINVKDAAGKLLSENEYHYKP